MPLLEALTIGIGSSVAKTIVSSWFGEDDLLKDATSSAADVISKHVSNVMDKRRAQRQFDRVAEDVARRLEKLIETEFRNLPSNEREAAVLACNDAMKYADLSSAALVARNVDPSKIEAVLTSTRKYTAQQPDLSEGAQQLASIILRECSNYIVEIAVTLPGFQVTTVHEVLRREDEIIELVGKVLDNMPRLRTGLKDGRDSAEALFETQYRRDTARNLDSLELFGLTLSEVTRRYSLSTAYITLTAVRENDAPSRADEALYYRDAREQFTLLEEFIQSAAARDVELSDAELDGIERFRAEYSRYLEYFLRDDEPEMERSIGEPASNDFENTGPARSIGEYGPMELRVDDAIATSKRLLIIGQAGSGKTTLLRWLAVKSGKSSFGRSLQDLNDVVPFFIQLRRFAGQELPAPSEFPRQTAKALSGQAPNGWVETQLTEGRALVLIDGVDEVASADRRHIFDWLQDLAETYPDSRYIVTTRPSAVSNRWLHLLSFDSMMLSPMSRLDIDLFVDHWHEAAAEKLQDEEELTSLRTLGAKLKARLADSSALRNLATSPLLCAMLCALNKDRRTNLPKDRTQLYRVALEMLLERRDQERDVSQDSGPEISLAGKEQILQSLAFWLMLNQRADLEKERAIEIVGRSAAQLVEDTAAPGVIFENLVIRSGMLREPSEGRVDFIHKTFQEYLAAKEAVQEDYIELLIENSVKDQWRETVVLAAGLGNQRQREFIIGGLLAAGDQDPSLRTQLHLLAAACQETAPRLLPETRSRIELVLRNLVPPSTVDEAAALATGGEIVVDLLQPFVGDSREEVVVNCLRCLSLIATDSALAAISLFANDGRPAVVNELVHAWSFFDPHRYAMDVLTRVPFPGRIIELHPVEFARYVNLLPQVDTVVCLAKGERNYASLENVDKAKRIIIQGNDYVDNLSGLSNVTDIEELTIEKCSSLVSLDGLDTSAIDRIDISDCPIFSDVDQLGGSELSRLSISDAPRRFKPDSLNNLRYLRVLKLAYVDGGTGIRSGAIKERASKLRVLRSMEQLTALSIVGAPLSVEYVPESVVQLAASQLTVLHRISALSSLRKLQFNASELRTFSDIFRCIGIESLRAINCGRVSNLEGIEALVQLNCLHLEGVKVGNLSLESCEALKQSDSIESLTISVLDEQGARICGYLPRNLKLLRTNSRELLELVRSERPDVTSTSMSPDA